MSLLLLTVDGNGQNVESELGFPYTTNFDKRQYSAHPQNTAVIQDHRGVMYIGNNDGILEYDGKSWRLIPTYNATAIRSLAMDDNHRIYVGAQGEFGYLSTDSVGQLEFVSLSENLPAIEKQFADVLNIYVASEGVYFLTVNRIFLLKDGQIQSWEPENALWPQAGFLINGKLYVNQRRRGLVQFSSGKFIDVPNGERLMNTRIYTMLPYGDDKILIGTRIQGLFLYDGKTAEEFVTKADEFFLENLVSGGVQLTESTYAISTSRGGFAIIDKEGNRLRIVNKNAGIADNDIQRMYLDSEKGLWLATGNGVSRVEVLSPISYFGKTSGLEGDVMALQRHDDIVFAATSQGLFYMQKQDSLSLVLNSQDNSFHAKFKEFKGFRTECRDLLSLPNALLVATSAGVYSIENNELKPVFEGSANVLYRSPSNPNRIYVGLEHGLVAVRKEASDWRIEFTFDNINDNITSLAETKEAIWATTALKGILKLRKTSGMPGPQNITRYTINNGLPSNKGNVAFPIGNDLVFSTDAGLYKLNESDDKLVPAGIFKASDPLYNDKVLSLEQGEKGLLWMITESKIGYAIPGDDGTYTLESGQLGRIPEGSFEHIYVDKNNIRWFCGSEGIVRYNVEQETAKKFPFHTLLTKVTTGEDSILFSGNYIGDNNTTGLYQNDFFKLVLPYQNNSLRFEFAAPAYDLQNATRYQFKLEGFNDSWSAWTDETKKEYTNISEGSYTFAVRAKNVFGNVSEEARYSFSILPPWYRTTYAYVGFGVAAIVFIYLVVVVRSKQLQREKRKLEATVKERTQELEESLVKLKKTQAQLVENEKLASLGQLTAGIAHEIKNPLNFVNNFAELSGELIEELEEDVNKHKDQIPDSDRENMLDIMEDLRMNVKKINEHGKRADNIVKGMLMHSRKESEEKEQVSVSAMLDENINFAYKGIRGENRDIDVEVVKEYDDSLGSITMHRSDVSRVVLNIAKNAFYAAHKKLTTEKTDFKPKVIFGGKRENGYVELFIEDNGVGISKDNMEKIFNPFFTTKPTGEGTGLGLSISHDIIVKGHGGELNVESEEGKFTRFTIKLPAEG